MQLLREFCVYMYVNTRGSPSWKQLGDFA